MPAHYYITLSYLFAFTALGGLAIFSFKEYRKNRYAKNSKK